MNDGIVFQGYWRQINGSAAACPVPYLVIALVFTGPEWNFKPESCAFVQDAFNTYGATHEFYKVLANCGSQAGSPVVPRNAVTGLREGIKYNLKLVMGYSGTRVGYLKPE